MLKAVLFDLDNTLIDWTHAEPWETYQPQRIKNVFHFVDATLCSLAHSTPDAFFEAYVAALNEAWTHGNETLRAPHIKDTLMAALAACGASTDQIDPQAVLDAYDWQPPRGERAYPDVIEVLPQIKAHGVELGVITNSSHPMIYRDRELQAMGILDLFSACRLAAVDVGVLKPHRDIFKHALRQLGVRPSEAVFVGDNLDADIKGAQDAGMYGVWRPTPDAAGIPLDGIVPDGTITTLHDLLPLLDGWYPGWREGSRA